MTGRAFILIFFFWALLTIVTPTLIRLSESSKSDLNSKGKPTSGVNSRRLMNSTQTNPSKTPVAVAPGEVPVAELSPAQSPGFSGETNTSFSAKLYQRARSNMSDSSGNLMSA